MQSTSIPRSTTTSEALLGLLSLGPMSGYQMRRLIEWSIGNFWSESFGQIYPALRRLREAGLVTMTRKAGDGRPDSKTYELTEEGRRYLEGWLQSPSEPQVPRNQLLLKIFFGGLVPTDVIRTQIAAFRELQVGRLEHFRATEQRLLLERAGDPRLPLWHMTLDYGLEESQALLRWAERSLAVCDELEASSRDAAESTSSAAPASRQAQALET